MASPSIGAQMAAVIGFIAMTVLLEPLVVLATPTTFSANYFTSTNTINSGYTTGFASPIINSGNSTSYGFGVLGQAVSTGFSLLSFVYGGLLIVWKSLINMPALLIYMFSNASSNIIFIPIGMGEIMTLIAFSYVLAGDILKLIGVYSKSDVENIGS